MTDETMQALVATSYGSPEDLTVAHLPIPQPGPGQIQVRVAASTLNPTDLHVIHGAFREAVPVEFPYVLGTEFAGTVTAVGAEVTRFGVGDEVFGMALPRPFGAIIPSGRPSLGTGGLAEYTVVEADTPFIAHRPVTVPAEEAVALAIAGSTAQAIMDVTEPRAGQTVLVVGATGATGLTVLPLLARSGATIVATARTEEGAELVRRLGADVVIGHDPAGYPAEVDAVLNLALPGDRLTDAARALRPGGRFVSIIFPEPKLDQLGRDDVELHFVWDMEGAHGGMPRLAEAAAAGEITPVIAHRYPLAEGVPAALRYANGHPLGKVVVTTGAGSSGLRVTRDRGVVTVVFDNPPVNVLSVRMMAELKAVLAGLRDDETAKVVVFESADPDFFLAHLDFTLVDDPDGLADASAGTPAGLNPFQALGEAVRTQPQVTIVKLAGLTRGGGAELVAAADMTFAAIGRARLGQPEALGGIVPASGGSQYLLHKAGRNRALEIILGADLFDAETAERYGWVNRALPAEELDAFVDRLARNVADLPEGTIGAVKHALPPQDLAAGLLRENEAWARQFTKPAAEAAIRGALRAGAQTRDGEQSLERLLRSAGAGPGL